MKTKASWVFNYEKIILVAALGVAGFVNASQTSSLAITDGGGCVTTTTTSTTTSTSNGNTVVTTTTTTTTTCQN
ncbi:hypothetical protein INT81_00225 [Riemerella anatipestifer]|nr:hypothetical protein [Riemerella anatipestifer]